MAVWGIGLMERFQKANQGIHSRQGPRSVCSGIITGRGVLGVFKGECPDTMKCEQGAELFFKKITGTRIRNAVGIKVQF